jgi:hypothetical protein
MLLLAVSAGDQSRAAGRIEVPIGRVTGLDIMN